MECNTDMLGNLLYLWRLGLRPGRFTYKHASTSS